MTPNEINFQKVFDELLSPNESDKFLVLATILTCFLCYLVAIVLARRVDNRIKAQVRIHGCYSTYKHNTTSVVQH